jgi:phosphatidylserine decarboxylase
MLSRLFVALQHLLPQHTLSGVMHWLARWRNPVWTRGLTGLFVKAFKVDMNDAAEPDPARYASFNAFFTRELAPGARPLAKDLRAVASPADGTISQIGLIRDGRIFQAKGHDYDVTGLLGGDEGVAEPFRGGAFATIYLSPRNYHRLHMPVTGRLTQTVYVPGKLFSVNAATTSLVPGLFARNERVVAVFDTDMGPMALVLVGAIFVGSIETVWQGEITPRKGPRQIERWPAPDGVRLEKGAELGRFNMGSTIIALFADRAVQWLPDLAGGEAVKLGETIGHSAR